MEKSLNNIIKNKMENKNNNYRILRTLIMKYKEQYLLNIKIK
jgi:hypothetical protein